MRYLLLPLSISLFRSLSGGNGCLIMPWAWYSGFALPVFLHKAVWRPPVEQTSPDKDVNCCYTTAAFTVSAEPRALLCCANSPADSALYAVSVRQLIALPYASSRQNLTIPPLP